MITIDSPEWFKSVYNLCERIHSHKPLNFLFTDYSLAVKEEFNVSGFRDKIKQSSIGAILLPDDSELGIVGSKHYPELDLKLNTNTRLLSVDLAGWIWDWPDKSWARELDINFLWLSKEGGTSTYEELCLYVSASCPNPSLSRKIWISRYAETGYEGHGYTSFEGSSTDVSYAEVFMKFCKELYENREL